MCWLTKAWPVDDESDRVFEVGAESEDGAAGWQGGSGAGGVSARAAKNCGAENADASNGIVNATRDGSFADQECVGDAGELLQGIFVAVGDWLARTICAGHNQDFGGTRGKQQMVQRRVGQHHAKIVIFRSDSRQIDLGFARGRWAERRSSSRLPHRNSDPPGCARLLYFLPSRRRAFPCGIFWTA